MPDDAFTLVGDPRNPAATPARSACTLIVLNRSPRLLRHEAFGELANAGYGGVISVEPRTDAWSVESLVRDLPGVAFLLPHESDNIGAMINRAASRVTTDYFLVTWSTLDLSAGADSIVAFARRSGTLCCVPFLRSERGESLPVLTAPVVKRRSVRVIMLPVRGDRPRTLLPYDFVGCYHTGRFSDLGGFDTAIASPYWQRIEFGFRANLWGQTISFAPGFRASYRRMPEPEDQTGGPDYARVFARMLLPRVTEQGAEIRASRLPEFVVRSGVGVAPALRIWSEARAWVASHRHHFVTDARHLVHAWSVDHE